MTLYNDQGQVNPYDPETPENASENVASENQPQPKAPTTNNEPPQIATAVTSVSASSNEIVGDAVYPNEVEVSVKLVGIRDRLKLEMARVRAVYENVNMQDKLRDSGKLPIDELHKSANEYGKAEGLSFEEGLAKALLYWFKDDFFVWFNAPTCTDCKTNPPMRGISGDDPRCRATPYETKYGGYRVEVYVCDICGSSVRFPRYNDPMKLIETRTGRCGEWANVFTAFCYALGLETRYVLDFTDHVWTEINLHGRWVHFDSCERTYDQPMLYENGWGKKLTYIFAITGTSCVDVTPKYSENFTRRLLGFPQTSEGRDRDCKEICKMLVELGQATREGLVLEGKLSPDLAINTYIQEVEENELIWETKPTNTENTSASLPARQTGSMEWKVSRGEAGDNNQK